MSDSFSLAVIYFWSVGREQRTAEEQHLECMEWTSCTASASSPALDTYLAQAGSMCCMPLCSHSQYQYQILSMILLFDAII
jgi:hypothetical protein